VHPSCLPEEALDLEVKYCDTLQRIGDRDIAFLLQEHADGIAARHFVTDESTLNRIHRELGEVIRSTLEIEVSGFGAQFDNRRGGFFGSYGDFLSSFQTTRKLKDLVDAGIVELSDARTLLVLAREFLPYPICARLAHADTNLGNLLVSEDGKLTSLVDWDSACGAPWEYAVAKVMSDLHATHF
jgi:thiamine kinase-like enzyme